MTNLQAALGCAQIQHIDHISTERRRVIARYETKLHGLPGVTMQQKTLDTTPLIWAVAVRLSPETYPQGRDHVIAALADSGIETRPGFQSPSQTDYFANQSFTVSDALCEWVISLPTFPGLEEAGIDLICANLAALARA